jgi:Fe-S-cluster-containing hydrogenase component 2
MTHEMNIDEGKRQSHLPRKETFFARRDFLKVTALAGGSLVLLGRFGVLGAAWAGAGDSVLKMVLVDFEKCTGCRTCETVCSSFNRKVKVGGETLAGLGNPFYSNIWVHRFNPEVDVPIVCAMCPDSPCVNACPVEPDSKTGRRALYRDENTGTIQNDPRRCIACSSCVEACANQRTGIIRMDPQRDKPMGFCTLCGGDPQCVKLCPFEALSLVEVRKDRKFYGLGPDRIAAQLTKDWYKI